MATFTGDSQPLGDTESSRDSNLEDYQQDQAGDQTDGDTLNRDDADLQYGRGTAPIHGRLGGATDASLDDAASDDPYFDGGVDSASERDGDTIAPNTDPNDTAIGDDGRPDY